MVAALEDVQVASPQAGVAVVSVANELDLATRAEFSALLHALVRQNELVVVDFSEALFIDSSRLNILVSGHKLALEHGACLRLELGDECAVKRTFEISGLLDELSWASSREEALNGHGPTSNHPAEESHGSRSRKGRSRRDGAGSPSVESSPSA
jgi:anti-anti-sigma factor